MKDKIRKTNVNVQCPHCNGEVNATVGGALDSQTISCPHCQQPIDLKSQGIDRLKREAQKVMQSRQGGGGGGIGGKVRDLLGRLGR